MKNSSLLIKLANSEAGRYVLGIKNDFPIVKISPNSWHFRIGKHKVRGIFHCYNVIEKCLSPYLVYKSLAKSYVKEYDDYKGFLHFNQLERNSKYPTIFLDVATIYSSAGDGAIRNSDSVWATVRGAASGASNDGTSASSGGGCPLTIFADPNYIIDRGFFPFVTSSLGADSIVSAATLNIYVVTKTDLSNGNVALIQTTQASVTALSNDDYNNLTLDSPSEGATRLDIGTDITTGAYNIWTLNATGLGWIDEVGNTLLGLREKRDIDNTTPDANQNDLVVRYSEFADTTSDPYLSVTYTPPTRAGYSFFM